MGQGEEKTLPREGGGGCWGGKKALTAKHSVHFILTHYCFVIAAKKYQKGKINKQEQHEQLKINKNFRRNVLANPVRYMIICCFVFH